MKIPRVVLAQCSCLVGAGVLLVGLWAESEHGSDPVGSRIARDDELACVVGYTGPNCFRNLGLCNGFGEFSCPQDAQRICLNPGFRCNGCTAATSTIICDPRFAMPPDVCTPLPSVACNTAEPEYTCQQLAGGCQCYATGLSVPCGKAATVAAGSTPC